tara:strand:- start:1042 stop:1224 length:183 start_codon:yes stop_codon:yes gene_type:complete
MKTEITNDFDALVQALELAITAPDNEKAQEVTAIADSISQGMDELEIARAKKLALENVNG